MGNMIQAKESVVTIEIKKPKRMSVPFISDGILNGDMSNLERMNSFSLYYGKENYTKYVVEGSIIGCTYGLEKTRIGITQDHAVLDENGNAILTCNDCVAGENVYSFGICCSPKVKSSDTITIIRPAPHVNPIVTGPKCRLVLTTKWVQDKAHTHIWNHATKQYEEVLMSKATLTCLYGQGFITIQEISNSSKIKEYVNLTIMNTMGWKKIHCGYVAADTGEDSPVNDKTSVIVRKHRNIDQTDIDKLNLLFNKFDITTKNRICAFFAECSAETENGMGMVEQSGTSQKATRANIEQWFKDNHEYGAIYRGGGAIQLTWKDNYMYFSNWMNENFEINDPDIMAIGTEHVAFKYPWEAAVFFWDTKNLNDLADAMNTTYIPNDLYPITAMVNKEMIDDEYQKRENAYKMWMMNYTIPN